MAKPAAKVRSAEFTKLLTVTFICCSLGKGLQGQMKSQQSMQGLLERRYLLTVFYRRRTLRKEGLPGGV
jgi:hypothetical protein